MSNDLNVIPHIIKRTKKTAKAVFFVFKY